MVTLQVVDLGGFGGSQHLILFIYHGAGLAIATSSNSTASFLATAIGTTVDPRMAQIIGCWFNVNNVFGAARGMLSVKCTTPLPSGPPAQNIGIEAATELAPADGGVSLNFDIYILALGSL